MLRNNWTFNYKPSVITAAAKAKLDFHRSREAYWKGEYEKAFEGVKASVEVRETPMVDRFGGGMTTMKANYSLSNDNTSTDIQITADPALRAHMENCRAKFRVHHDTADTYETYYLALGIQDDSIEVPLHIDDVIYFGIVGWSAETETAKDA